MHAPDVVGNIRVDQAWGLFQISGALHEVDGSYNVLNTAAAPAGALGLAGAAPTALSEISGHPETKWGGSVMAALQIKNIPTGPGDDIKIDATWAKGDTKNVISTSATSPSFAMFGGIGRAGAYQSIGFGATTDAVYLARRFAGGDGSLHLTEAFGVRGAFNHNWDPYWSSSLFGSYSGVRYDGTAKANICAVYTAARVTAAQRRLQLQPGLQRRADRRGHPLDSCQEPDVLGRSHVLRSRPEVHWHCHLGARRLRSRSARYEFKDQDTVRSERPRSA